MSKAPWLASELELNRKLFPNNFIIHPSWVHWWVLVDCGRLAAMNMRVFGGVKRDRCLSDSAYSCSCTPFLHSFHVAEIWIGSFAHLMSVWKCRLHETNPFTRVLTDTFEAIWNLGLHERNPFTLLFFSFSFFYLWFQMRGQFKFQPDFRKVKIENDTKNNWSILFEKKGYWTWQIF